MSSGPIEFLSDVEGHDVPATEMGGADGLIQPAKVGEGEFAGAPEAQGGHSDEALYEFEKSGIAGRAAGVPLVVAEQRSGESLTGEVVQDPVTGRTLKPDQLEDGLAANLSDLQP